MTKRHAAAFGCSDEDQMAEIKERVERPTWLHMSRSSSLSKTDGPDIKREINVISYATVTLD